MLLSPKCMPVRTRTMAAAITVSDFEFVFATLLRQGNDTPLLLREAVTDIASIMCMSDRDIERFKFPDDSSGTIVLIELDYGHRQLIRCFHVFARKRSAEGNPMHSDWQNLANPTEFRKS
jgi:hypothetical protein